MNRKHKLLILIPLTILAGLAVAGLPRANPTPQIGGKGKTPAQPAAGKDAHEQDIAAIKKAMQSFLAAFEKGDAKAVAAHWTPEGEYIADDGAKYQGRKELEEAY